MTTLRLLAPLVGAICFASAVHADDVLLINSHAVRVDAGTSIVVDGETLPAGSPVPNKPGLRAEARYNAATTAAGVNGAAAAATVVFSYAVRGPVTSTTPLRVDGGMVGNKVFVAELARATLTPKPTVTFMIKRMEAAGFVLRVVAGSYAVSTAAHPVRPS